MDKKQRDKMEFSKGRQKENQKENRLGRKEEFQRQAFWGNKIDKKPLKLPENSLFGPFYKTQAQKHRQQKTKPPKSKQQKTYQKKTFLHFGKQPLFLVKFCFFKLRSFMSTKLCFAENTLKIVFSAEHSF